LQNLLNLRQLKSMDKLQQEISIAKEYIETTLDVLREALILPEKKVIE